MRFRCWLWKAAVAVIFGTTLAADEVDNFIAAEMERQHIPGFALAILKDGKLLKAQGYGVADRASNRPVTTNTLFQIQSITKLFTASGIMLLAEEGKIRLEDRISKYLDKLPASWSNVTVRHLLNHTSGIKDFINEPTVNLTNDISPEGIVESLADKPLNFATGEKYRYSNTGYQLLGMIIHRLTGKPWHDYLNEKLFQPARMSSTRVNNTNITFHDLALGYCWEKDEMKPGYPVAMSILSYPGGGLLSSVVDLAAWDSVLRRGEILKQSLLTQMWTPARLNDGSKVAYGLGWSIEDYHGRRYVSHGGAHMTGFKTIFLHFLDEKVTVIALTNQRGANPANIAIRVAGLYIPELLLNSMAERSDPDPKRTRKLRQWLSDLSKGEFPSAMTPQFKTQYAAETERQKTLAERLRQAKGFAFLGNDNVTGKGIERLGVPIETISYYKMPTETEVRYYIFYLAADQKLAYYQSSEF